MKRHAFFLLEVLIGIAILGAVWIPMIHLPASTRQKERQFTAQRTLQNTMDQKVADWLANVYATKTVALGTHDGLTVTIKKSKRVHDVDHCQIVLKYQGMQEIVYLPIATSS